MKLCGMTLVALIGLAGCAAPPEKPSLPHGFPDPSSFTAVDPADFRIAGLSFTTPDQIRCQLDFGPQESMICDGDLAGFPTGTPGTGCPVVRKPDGAPSDSAYVLGRWDNPCGTSHSKPITVGKKLVGDNGTCMVGTDNLVACIDKDLKHGFVLKQSGAQAF
jgi:hypothetical protein